MTRLRRREPRTRAQLTEGAIRQLLTGDDYFGPPDDFGDLDGSGEAEAAFRAAWSANRAELLDGWIASNPGTRPAAWWKFDAPEPRRRRDGLPCSSGELHFGTPRFTVAPFVEFETEREYLERLGLLRDEERRTAGD